MANASDKEARLALAALALREAITSGAPFTAELAAARSLGIDAAGAATLEPLAATGVPGAATLAQQLSALVPALRKAAGDQAPRAGGFLDQLEANASKLVRIRPVGDGAGSDPSAIIARAEARAAKQDIAGALAELKALPAGVRAPADGWIATAEARQAALDTSRKLAAERSRLLGRP